MIFFGCIVSSVNPLENISMNNQKCWVRPEKLNINSDEPSFYLYSIEVNKCSGSCNNINPYVRLCAFLMLLKT